MKGGTNLSRRFCPDTSRVEGTEAILVLGAIEPENRRAAQASLARESLNTFVHRLRLDGDESSKTGPGIARW
jgi:hypothetical protein